MTNIIEFPGMGITLEINRVAFTLFGLDVYWYGVCIGVGMLLALVYAFSQAKRFGVDSDRMIDVVFIGLICAIVGGRLFYVLFSDIEYTTFRQLIDLRQGGIAIYGAIIAAFLCAWLACKWRKVPVLPLFDLAGMGFLIGQALGRWGNFFNQEAFGTNTTLPWGMRSATTTAYLAARQVQLAAEGVIVDPALPVHPTFLYESLWCILGFLLLHLYRKHRHFNGEIFLFYIMWYGLGRGFIEGLRTDSLMTPFFNMRVSQLIGFGSFAAALIVWIIARRKTAGQPLKVPEIPPHTAQVKLQTADGPQVVQIAWPAYGKVPTKAEREEMAQKILAEQQNPPSDVSSPEPEEKQEDIKPAPETKTETADKEEDDGGENH